MTKAAKEICDAIRKLFGDTKVSLETTLSDLEEIRDEAEERISAIQDDLKSKP